MSKLGYMSTGTPPNIEINGFALREIRIRSGIDSGPFADQAEISRPYLVRIELGARVRVSPRVFAALCSTLQIQDKRAILSNPHTDVVDLTEVTA